jgi:hypothetical protein
MDVIRSEVKTENVVRGSGRHVSHIGTEMHNDRQFQGGEPKPDLGAEETLAVGATINPVPGTSLASQQLPGPVIKSSKDYNGSGVLPGTYEIGK